MLIIREVHIPCLTIPEEEQQPIGIWGRRHLRYIREYRKGLYNSLLLSGKLNGYLADLNGQAEEMFFRLVEQLAENDGITKTLKAEDQMLWVQRKNAVRETATEIVLTIRLPKQQKTVSSTCETEADVI